MKTGIIASSRQSIHRFLGLAVCPIILSCLATPVRAQGNYSSDFSSGTASGWTVGSGTWAVSGGTYNCTASSYNATTVYTGATWSNGYTLSASIASPYSSAGNQFGLLYNYVDANDYYELRFSPAGTVTVNNVVSGTSTTVATGSWTFPGYLVAFTATVTRNGSNVTSIQVNGTTVISGVTQSTLGAGGIGLRASYNLSEFGTVTVTPNSYTDFSDWTVESGTWSVTGGTDECTASSYNATTVYTGATWSNGYTLSASIASPYNSAGNQFGLLYNYVDANDYYELRFSPAGTVTVNNVVSGTSTTVATGSWTFPGYLVPFTATVTRNGSNGTSIQVNGTTVISGVTQSTLGAGGIGLRASYNLSEFSSLSMTTTDTTPPSVSITAPTSGADVSGSAVTVSATASDNVGVADVQFQLDGTNLGSAVTMAPYSVSWDSTTATNGSHSLTAIATDTSGNNTTSSAVSVTVNNSTALPSPWMTQDVGSVGATGSASYSSGTFTLEGSGTDIYGTADEFRFAYQQITGDCTIIAEVNSVQQTGSYAKGGIMIRNDLTAGAENATLVVTAAAGDDVNFQQRTSAGGTTTQTYASGVTAPQWLKLVRAGNSFTAFYSSNGTSWTQLGTAETVGIGSTAYVGLVTDSFDNGTLCTSTFSNVSVTGSSSYSYSQNFSANAIGMTPVLGTWAWESATATYNTTNDGSGTNVAVYDGLTWNTGYTYSAVIESPQSTAGDLVGLVYNYVDANDYYWLSLNPSGTAQLWKVISGTATQVGSNASWTFPGVNSAINVSVTRGTGTTTVAVNGSTIFNAVSESDSQIGAGNIGFYSNGNTPTFTSVTVSGTATAPSAYYVDSVGGSDSNNGTSPTTAWKTIAKVNASTFSAGAMVLFDRGDTWHEQLTIPSSGSSGQPIVFGAYGSGALPLIDATIPVTSGWTAYSGNIYVASVGSAVYQVYVNGAALPVAHYPTSGYLTTTGSSTTESYIVDSNHPTQNLVGADIRVLSESWAVDESVITSVSGSQINDSEANGQGWPAGTGTSYAVGNMLWMLQGAGEWFYDSTAGNLYLWMPDGSNPNGQNVRASTLPYGVYASGQSYITIQDLAINGSYGTGVWLQDIPQFLVQRLTLTNIGALRCTTIFQDENGTGVFVSRSTPTGTDLGVISNNTITNAVHDGIFGYQTENLTIADNVITNVGQAGWNAYQPCVGNGIEVVYTCPNTVVEHNVISNTSNDGISLNSQNNIVKENVIQNCMDELSDGGAIYTSGTDTNGTLIEHNVCLNVGNTKAFGVYMDEGSQYETVENNTVGNMPHGTMCHFGRYNTVENNTIYGVLYDAVEIQEDSLAPSLGYTTGNVYENNIYFANGSISLVALSNWFSNGAGHFSFGTYSDNTFSSPDPSQAIETEDDTATTYYTVAAWQTAGNESGSTFVPQNGTNTSIFLVNTTSTPQTYQFSNYGVSGRTYTNLNGSSVSWPITLQPYDSLILIWSGH